MNPLDAGKIRWQEQSQLLKATKKLRPLLMGITRGDLDKLRNATKQHCHLDMTPLQFKMEANALALQMLPIHTTNMANLPNAMEVLVDLWLTMCTE